MQSDSWLMSHCWQNPLTLIYSCHFFLPKFCWTGLTWFPDYAILGIIDIALIRKVDLRQCELLNSIASARFPLLPDSPISPPPLSPRSQRPIRKWFFHQILEKISLHMATRGWQNDKEWRMFKFSSSLSTFCGLPPSDLANKNWCDVEQKFSDIFGQKVGGARECHIIVGDRWAASDSSYSQFCNHSHIKILLLTTVFSMDTKYFAK